MSVERFDVVVAFEQFCSAPITVRPATGATATDLLGDRLAGKLTENARLPVTEPDCCAFASGDLADKFHVLSGCEAPLHVFSQGSVG